MGNIDSSNAIHVETEQPHYQSGQIVQGYVSLSLIETYPAQCIYLKVKGEERVEITQLKHEKNQQGVMITTEHIKQESHTFFKQMMPIQEFPEQCIEAGQYKFPFRFILPNDLPGSFYLQGEDNGKFLAKINYTVKAVTFKGCNSKQRNFIIKKEDQLSFKQNIVIREASKYNNDQTEAKATINVKEMCFLDAGKTEIRTFFDKNMYTIGDVCVVSNEIDNTKCQLDIKNLTAQMETKLVLKAQGITKNIHLTYQKMEFEGVKAKQIATNQDMRVKSFTLDKAIGKHNVACASGKLISSHNMLNMKVNFNGCICCANHPLIHVPIQFYQQDDPSYKSILEPDYWAPKLFDLLQFQFKQEYNYISQGWKKMVAIPVRASVLQIPSIAGDQDQILDLNGSNISDQVQGQQNYEMQNYQQNHKGYDPQQIQMNLQEIKKSCSQMNSNKRVSTLQAHKPNLEEQSVHEQD